MAPLRSTAIRFPSRQSSRTRSATVPMGRSNVRSVPLTVNCTKFGPCVSSRYCRYRCIAVRRNAIWRSKREQAAQTDKCSRSTSRCHAERGRSSRSDMSRDASLHEMMWPSALLSVSGGRAGGVGSGVSVIAGEPVLFEAQAQRHPGSVKDDPQVIRVDRQFLTDLVRLELHHLPHHEDSGGVGRQLLEAKVHDVEELTLVERLLGARAPLARFRIPASPLVEQRVEILDVHFRVDVAERRGDRRLALLL